MERGLSKSTTLTPLIEKSLGVDVAYDELHSKGTEGECHLVCPAYSALLVAIGVEPESQSIQDMNALTDVLGKVLDVIEISDHESLKNFSTGVLRSGYYPVKLIGWTINFNIVRKECMNWCATSNFERFGE